MTDKSMMDYDWSCLPDECLIAIFSFLPKEHYRVIRMTCLKWNAVSSDKALFQRKLHINVAVVGVFHKSGKSTLIGNLLWQDMQTSVYKKKDNIFTAQQMEKIFRDAEDSGHAASKYAWVLDSAKEERESCTTIRLHRRRLQCEDFFITFIDTPGKLKFMKNMVCGIAQAEYVLYVLPSKLETVTEHTSEIKQQLKICKVAGIKKLVVAINHMDEIEDLDKQKESFYKIKDIFASWCQAVGLETFFLPTSGWTGKNLIRREMDPWWRDHPSLMEALENLPMPSREFHKPLRISIDSTYKVPGTGTVIVGTVLQGVVEKGQWVCIGPIGHVTQVKSMHLAIPQQEILYGYPGDYVSLAVRGMSKMDLPRRLGLITGFLKHKKEEESLWLHKRHLEKVKVMKPEERSEEIERRRKDGPMYPVTSFTATITILALDSPKSRITEGFEFTLHCHNAMVPVKIEKIKSLLHRNNKNVAEDTEKKMFLIPGDQAVVEIETKEGKEIGVDTRDRCRKLGSFILRNGFEIAGAGIITDLNYSFLRNKEKMYHSWAQ